MAYTLNIDLSITVVDDAGNSILAKRVTKAVSLTNFVHTDIGIVNGEDSVEATSLDAPGTGEDLKDCLIVIPEGNMTIELATAGTEIEIQAGFPFLFFGHTTELTELLLTNDVGADTTVTVIGGDYV